MPSIFSPTDNANIIARIQLLRASSKAQWGKMTAAQMLAHCQRPIQVATGELTLKRGLIGFLFGNMAKKKILQEGKGFGKNSPTDPHFIVKDDRDFEAEKAALIPMIARFTLQGTSLLTKEKHPFFGKLSVEEWDALMWKHLDHHLEQFGV